jgi:hypothetical protein
MVDGPVATNPDWQLKEQVDANTDGMHDPTTFKGRVGTPQSTAVHPMALLVNHCPVLEHSYTPDPD